MSLTPSSSSLPPWLAPPPVIDYTSRDYASLLNDLLNLIPSFLPEWTTQSPTDFGVALLEIFSYVGDILNYYIDRVANESFLLTATQLESVLNIASMLDYSPPGPQSATGSVTFTLTAGYPGSVTIPAGTAVLAPSVNNSGGPVPFQTTAPLTILGNTVSPPQMMGSVGVVQGVSIVNEVVGVSSAQPNQSFPLQYPSVTPSSLVISVDQGYGPQVWQLVGHLVEVDGFVPAYSISTDSNGVTTILFGDGANGVIPGLNATIYASYIYGGGTVGNVGSNTITQLGSPITGVASVTNSQPTTGGANAFTLAQIRAAIPASLQTANRAVTLSDISTLATQVPGVQLASALASTYQLINLYIAPFGGWMPSSTLVQQVQNYLQNLVMVNTSVTVLNPSYVGVNLTATVYVAPQYNATTVEQNVITALQTALSLGTVGFGSRVSLSAMYSVIDTTPGVLYSNISLLARADGTQSGAADCVYQTYEIPVAGTLTRMSPR
jgi:hypothetical protein